MRHGVIMFAAVVVAASCGDAGVEDLSISDPSTYHQRSGFTQLVPPVHLPSSSDEMDQVEIWIRIPEGKPVGASRDATGKLRLEFPPGTVADRVEFAGLGDGRFVADVRGATVLEGGKQQFHAYRPVARRPGAELVGVAWARGDEGAHARATARFLDRIRKTEPASSMDAAALEKLVASVEKKNECRPCHEVGRADNRKPNEHGLVNRGTDASGFFTPSTVLENRIPLEQYGRFDRSLRDGAIEIECGEGRVEFTELVHRRCPDSTIAIGVWDPSRAFATDPVRAQAVCRSRRFLYDKLDDSGRNLFGDPMANCQGT